MTLPGTADINFEPLRLPEKNTRVTIARLDKFHPLLSGNKIFKLYYFIKEAQQYPYKSICTFGGAYSNHLLATAYACKNAGLMSIGYVLGVESASHTLDQCRDLGMELQFVGKGEYYALQESLTNTESVVLVPEGGYHPLG